MTRGVIFIAASLLLGCSQSVLPAKRDLLGLSKSEIRQLVLDYAAIGSSRGEVERALRRSFHKDWRVMDYDTVEYMSGLGFSVPVSGGDYYFMSNFAVVNRTVFTSDVVTVYFLFDRQDKLKDVLVTKWSDSI